MITASGYLAMVLLIKSSRCIGAQPRGHVARNRTTDKTQFVAVTQSIKEYSSNLGLGCVYWGNTNI